MPFVNFAQDEDKDQESTKVAQPIVTLHGSSGETGSQGLQNQGPGTGASLTNTAQAPQSSRSSGTFTNLNKYLDANRAGAANIGNRVATEVSNQASQATKDINQSGADFGRRVSEGTNQFNEGLVNEATSDATNFINDPNKVSQLQKQKSGSFGGPTSYTDSTEAQKALLSKQKAEETANLTGTVGGRQQLIRNTNTSNPYSQGGLSLNQFLVQNNQGALGKVLDSAQASKGLGGQLTNTQTGADQAVKTGQDVSNKTGVQTNQKLTGAVSDFRGKLGQQATEKSTQEQAEQAGITQAFGGGANAAPQARNVANAFTSAGNQAQFPDVSDEILSKVGLSREQYSQLQALNNEVVGAGRVGINPLDFVQNTQGQYTEGGVASTQQQAYLAALQQLAGTNQQLNSGGFAGNSRFDLQSALNALLSQTGGTGTVGEDGSVTGIDGSVIAGGVGGLSGVGTVAKIIKELIDKQKAEKAAQEQAEADAAQRAEAERQLAEQTRLNNNPVPVIPPVIIPPAETTPSTPQGSTTITEIDPVTGQQVPANQQPNNPLGGAAGAGVGAATGSIPTTPQGTVTITEGNNIPQNTSNQGSVGSGGSSAIPGGAIAGGLGAAAGTLAGAAPAGTVIITEGVGQLAAQTAAAAGTGAAGAATGSSIGQAGTSALSEAGYGSIAKTVGNSLAIIGAAYGAYSTYNAAKAGDTKSAILNGAATGAAIGSVVPGIGTVIGAAIGAVVGGIGSLFGSSPKASEVAYHAYKNLSPQDNIRGYTIPQASSGYFEAFKAHKNSGKFPVLNDLYSALGASGGDHKTVSSKMLEFIEGVIQTAQQAQGLPDDDGVVRQLDGQRIYRLLVAPAIDAMIGEKLGIPGYDRWTNQGADGNPFPGTLDAYSEDITDWIISQWGTNKTSMNDYAAGRKYVNPSFAPPPPAPVPVAQPVYSAPSTSTGLTGGGRTLQAGRFLE